MTCVDYEDDRIESGLLVCISVELKPLFARLKVLEQNE